MKCHEAAWPPSAFLSLSGLSNTGCTVHTLPPLSGWRWPLPPSREVGGSLASDGGLQGPALRPAQSLPALFFFENGVQMSAIYFFKNFISLAILGLHCRSVSLSSCA